MDRGEAVALRHLVRLDRLEDVDLPSSPAERRRERDAHGLAGRELDAVDLGLPGSPAVGWRLAPSRPSTAGGRPSSSQC
jgi:hypothetical protein